MTWLNASFSRRDRNAHGGEAENEKHAAPRGFDTEFPKFSSRGGRLWYVETSPAVYEALGWDKPNVKSPLPSVMGRFRVTEVGTNFRDSRVRRIEHFCDLRYFSPLFFFPDTYIFDFDKTKFDSNVSLTLKLELYDIVFLFWVYVFNYNFARIFWNFVIAPGFQRVLNNLTGWVLKVLWAFWYFILYCIFFEKFRFFRYVFWSNTNK